MDDQKLIAETVLDLGKKVLYLQKQVHFQAVAVRAFRSYTIEQLAKLKGTPKGKEVKRVSELVRLAYDNYISEIGKIDRAFAARLDMRADMPEQVQDGWYLISEDFPRKDDSPGPDEKE